MPHLSESARHYIYLAAFVLFLALIIVDVFRGGDAGEWVIWIAGLVGLTTTGLAAKNTSR